MAHVPTVPNFAQYNFALGDTDAAITKQNGQNAALVTFGNELRQTMTTLNSDIDQVVQDKAAAAQSASDALNYRNQAQEITEGGLPPKAGNAGRVLKVANDEQTYELGELEEMLDAAFRRMVPAGSVMGFPFTSAPPGWLKCNGAAVSRTAYADLFAAIGTTFGNGNGSTTFNLPDYRGEFPRWLDDGRGIDSGRDIDEPQGDQNKQHNHGGSTWNDTHSHSGSTDSDSHNHSGNTHYDGVHDHDIRGEGGDGGSGTGRVKTKGDTGTPDNIIETFNGGNHRHSFTTDTDTHNHSLNINSNTHDHGISMDGGDEARPRNMPLLACIRY